MKRITDAVRDTLTRSARFLYDHGIKPFSADEDSQRKEYILNIILLGSIAMLVMLDGLVTYHSLGMGSAYHEISIGAFSTIPAFFILLYVLSRKGRFVPASYLLIAAYFVSTGYAASRWGVELATVLLSYALVIVISGILIGTAFGFFMAAITAIFISPLWYLQAHGRLIIQKQSIDGTDGLVFAAFYFLIMTVTWLSNREVEKSLARARHSEHELAQQRDRLEITVEERTQELRAAEFEKVEQLYRFAELGRLAQGLFHDMLNVVTAISLKVERQTPVSETEKARTDASLNDAFSTTRHIEHFMQAIRRQLDHRESQESFSVGEAIEQVIQLTSYKATKEDVGITLAQPQNPAICFGDSFKFHQVLLNLILNAVESYEGTPKENRRERIVAIRMEKSNESVTVTVEDHGSGIPHNNIEKIFDPFFTTKSGEKGTGIGLANAKKIIEENFSGTITAQSDENRTVFTVSFSSKNDGEISHSHESKGKAPKPDRTGEERPNS